MTDFWSRLSGGDAWFGLFQRAQTLRLDVNRVEGLLVDDLVFFSKRITQPATFLHRTRHPIASCVSRSGRIDVLVARDADDALCVYTGFQRVGHMSMSAARAVAQRGWRSVAYKHSSVIVVPRAVLDTYGYTYTLDTLSDDLQSVFDSALVVDDTCDDASDPKDDFVRAEDALLQRMIQHNAVHFRGAEPRAPSVIMRVYVKHKIVNA